MATEDPVKEMKGKAQSAVTIQAGNSTKETCLGHFSKWLDWIF